MNTPTVEQRVQYERDGYFIARGLADRQATEAIKEEILRCVLDRPPDSTVLFDR